MAGFLQGFQSTFSPSFNRGMDMAQRQSQFDQEFALKKQAADQEAKLRGLQIEGAQRVNDATNNLTQLTTRGVAQPDKMFSGTGGIDEENPNYFRPATERDIAAGARALASAKGDGGGVIAAQSNIEGIDKRGRQKDFFSKFNNMPDEQLMQDPQLRALLNDNPKIKGAVGYDPATKRYIVSDYQGSGVAQSFSRAELMDAAMQLFEQGEGDIDKSITRGLGRSERAYSRARQGVQDSNAGLKTAHSMNMDEEKVGIERGKLGVMQAHERRAAARDKDMDPKDIAALNELSTRISQEKDPKKRVSMEPEYQRLYGIAATKINKVVPPQVSKPGAFKWQNTGEGQGYLADETGNAVAQFMPGMGMVPFGPSPMDDPAAKARMARSGVTVGGGYSNGQFVWGYKAPNGEVYSTLEEAERTATNRAGAGRGMVVPPRATPHPDSAPTQAPWPQSSRGPVGQGAATLPWEAPTGTW